MSDPQVERVRHPGALRAEFGLLQVPRANHSGRFAAAIAGRQDPARSVALASGGGVRRRPPRKMGRHPRRDPVDQPIAVGQQQVGVVRVAEVLDVDLRVVAGVRENHQKTDWYSCTTCSRPNRCRAIGRRARAGLRSRPRPAPGEGSPAGRPGIALRSCCPLEAQCGGPRTVRQIRETTAGRRWLSDTHDAAVRRGGRIGGATGGARSDRQMHPERRSRPRGRRGRQFDASRRRPNRGRTGRTDFDSSLRLQKIHRPSRVGQSPFLLRHVIAATGAIANSGQVQTQARISA